MLQGLYEIVRQRAERYPDAVAVGSQEGGDWRTVNGRQLLDHVDTLAAELQAMGLAEGDRVVLWLPGAWLSPVYMFAIWKLGAIVVPLDREVNPEGVARVLASVEPRLIITGHGLKPDWAQGAPTHEWWQPGSKMAAGATASAPAAGTWQRPAEELAALFFTSGTTGNPKGCMISHANVISQIEAYPALVPLDASSRLASILPLSHVYEFTVGMLYPLYSGAAIHYVPNRRGGDIVRVFQEQQITHMTAVPQLLALMAKGVEQQLRAKLPGPLYKAMNALADRLPMAGRRRLFFMVHRHLGGQLRVMTSAAAALPPEVRHFWERLGVRIINGYGTSECSPVVTGAAFDGSTPYGSVGKPLPGITVKLSPEGEVLVKGPNVMRGYWRDPEHTAEVLRDGWYHSGDLGMFDERGNLTLVGRSKELIVLPSGLKVWPQDIEEVLRQDPAVKDAAVVHVPTAGGGGKLHAYLLANPEVKQAAVDLLGLMARVNARLAQHQRFNSVSWWPEEDFPRTQLLKLKRHLLPLPGKAAASAEGQADKEDSKG